MWLPSRRELLELAGLSLSAQALSLPGRAFAGPIRPRDLEVLSDFPQQLSTPIEWFDQLLTPNDVFFVRSHFGPPALDLKQKLRISGLVEAPFELSLDELKRLPQTTVTAVLQCAGNGRGLFSPVIPGVQWMHGAMGQAEWTGVRVKTLLEKARVKNGAAHLHLAAGDVPPKPATPAFDRSIPLEKALHPDTLVAWKMNGVPLPWAHGAPFRLVVPGWAGDHWLKWLTELKVAEAESEAFFVKKGYRIPPKPVAPGTKVPPEQMVPVTAFPVKSIIARPLTGSQARVGPQEIVGVAFSGSATVSHVEVSVDGGKSWSRAQLEGTPGVGRWQLFRHRFTQKTPGLLLAMARATDSAGATQPEQAVWNPSGYFWNAWHKVSWEVTA